jgi:hypothetical protein
MAEPEYWVIKCKICGHFHVGNRVDRANATLALPIDGPRECPLHPPRTARYRTDEWRIVTGSQMKELNKPSDS